MPGPSRRGCFTGRPGLCTQACVLGSALVVAAFMVLLQMPGASSAVLLPLLALTWAASFPLAVVAQVRCSAMRCR